MAVLKWCPYMGASIYSLHVNSAFDGRTGFDVNTSHAFPQGVLAAITSVGGGAGDGGARAGVRYEVGLPPCLLVSLPYWEWN